MTPQQEKHIREMARAAAIAGLGITPAVNWFESTVILQHLVMAEGNVTRAAETLGFERASLQRKAKRIGLLPWRRSRRDDIEGGEP